MYLAGWTGRYTYVLWSDSSTDSSAGWYRAKVTSYHCDGSCSLHYDNGDIEPSVDIHSLEWCFARCYRKNYRVDKPVNTIPSVTVHVASAETKSCLTKVHKAKGLLMTWLLSLIEPIYINKLLLPLCWKLPIFVLCFNLPNVYPFIFNGHQVVPTTEYSMSNGNTTTSVVLTVPDF